MGAKASLAGGIIGVIFLALGLFKFLQGEAWVVWIILGFLFGGFAAVGRLIGGRSAS